MFRYSVVAEFLTWVAFLVIWKALVHFVNIEARRSAGFNAVAGVTGLLA